MNQQNQNNQKNQQNQNNQQKPSMADILKYSEYDRPGELAMIDAKPTMVGWKLTCSQFTQYLYSVLLASGIRENEIARINHVIGDGSKNGQVYVGFYIWFTQSPRLLASKFKTPNIPSQLEDKIPGFSELSDEFKRILHPFTDGNLKIHVHKDSKFIGVELNEFLVVGNYVKFNPEVSRLTIAGIERIIDSKGEYSDDAVLSIVKELIPISEINARRNSVDFTRMSKNVFRR